MLLVNSTATVKVAKGELAVFNACDVNNSNKMLNVEGAAPTTCQELGTTC